MPPKANRRIERPAPTPPIQAPRVEIVPRDSGMPFDLEGTMQAIADAIKAGAGDLSPLAFGFLRGDGPTALRLRLIMLSNGVEEGPRSSQTYPARVMAAKRALECWGPA